MTIALNHPLPQIQSITTTRAALTTPVITSEPPQYLCNSAKALVKYVSQHTLRNRADELGADEIFATTPAPSFLQKDDTAPIR